jgi:hypothetical protein
MTLLRRLALPVLLAIVIPTSVLAASGPTVKLTPKAPAVVTSTSLMTMRINFHQKVTALTMLCLTVTFGGDSEAGDLLDPLEMIWIDALFGQFNVGTEPLSSITLCSEEAQPLEVFLEDKAETTIRLVGAGHVRITDVSVTAYSLG